MHVIDLEGPGRNIEYLATVVESTHPASTASDDDFSSAELVMKFFEQAASCIKIGPASDNESRRLVEIRFDERCPSESPEIALGVRDDEAALAARKLDDPMRESIAKKPLVIVLEHDDMAILDRLDDGALELFLEIRTDGRILFAIETKHLLATSHHAQFVRRRPGGRADDAHSRDAHLVNQ